MNVLLSFALIAYTAGIVFAAIAVVYRNVASRTAASMTWPIAWSAHLVALVMHGVTVDGFPVSNAGEYLLLLGWALMTLHLYLWYRKRVFMSGLVLPPLAAVATLVAWNLLPHGPAALAVRPRGLFVVHTTLATLGVATLGVAFVMSLAYLAQDRALKTRKRLELLERLPALEICDHLGFNAMLVGFALLSLGIGTGVAMNAHLYDRVWEPGLKQGLAGLAWLVFAGVIASRAAFGFRGRKSAWLTIAGFALGLLTVVGMTFR